MGLIAKLLSFTRVDKGGVKLSDVKLDPDGGANIIGNHFASPGDDSFPLDTDFVAAVGIRGSGSAAVLGYADPSSEPKATKGEKRIYARDPSDGATVCEVWLKSDGTILSSNDNGLIELKADGSGLISSPGGDFEVKADGSIKGNNSAGSFELQVGGNFVVNGVVIDPAGNITSPTVITSASVVAPIVTAGVSLTVAGKEMTLHTHSGVTSGPASTGPPN